MSKLIPRYQEGNIINKHKAILGFKNNPLYEVLNTKYIGGMPIHKKSAYDDYGINWAYANNPGEAKERIANSDQGKIVTGTILGDEVGPSSFLKEVNINTPEPKGMTSIKKRHARQNADMQQRVASREGQEWAPRFMWNMFQAPLMFTPAAYALDPVGTLAFNALEKTVMKPLSKLPKVARTKRLYNRIARKEYKLHNYGDTYVNNVLNKTHSESLYPPIVNSYKLFDVEPILFRYEGGRSVAKDMAHNIIPVKYQDIAEVHHLADVSPEYIEFLRDNKDLNPLAQETVNKFIERQSKSIRGIYVPKNEVNGNSAKEYLLAKKYLTMPPENGPDRLGNSGLYTSNGRFIADKFMRPQYDSEKYRSLQGLVKYNFHIDKSLPIEEQLKQYRNQVDNWFDISSKRVYNPEAKMIEAEYARNTGERSKSIYERSINSHEGNNVVDLIHMDDFGYGNENLHGRWGLSGGDSDNDLFIPKRINNSEEEFNLFKNEVEKQGTITHYYTNPERIKAKTEIENQVSKRINKEQELNRKFDKYAYKKIYPINKAVSITTATSSSALLFRDFVKSMNKISEEQSWGRLPHDIKIILETPTNSNFNDLDNYGFSIWYNKLPRNIKDKLTKENIDYLKNAYDDRIYDRVNMTRQERMNKRQDQANRKHKTPKLISRK